MKEIKIYILSILLLLAFHVSLFTLHLSAQAQQEWVRRYQPDSIYHNASGNALVLDDSGNVYIAGEIEINNVSTCCTIKYSTAGVQQWVSLFQGIAAGGRTVGSIALDKSWNVYVTGYSYRYGSYFDYCTIKYNSSGVQQWVQYYDGPGHGIDQAQKIGVDNSGNIYVTGFSSIGGNYFVYTTIKYSIDGRQLWVRSYGVGGINTYANDMIVDDSCNVYITGINNGDAVTIKYDSSGSQKWLRTYITSEANSITIDRYHNVYITGSTVGLTDYSDYLTIKYSTSGVQQWARRFNLDSMTSTSYYQANSVAVDDTGNIYVSGDFRSDQGAPMKLCTVKYSNNGNLTWVRRHSDTLGSGFTCMSIDKRSNIYIAGATVSPYSQYPTYGTYKYDSSGILKWIVKYDNSLSGPEYPFSVKVDNRDNVFVTGSDMLTIKYSQLVGIKLAHNSKPNRFKLYQNFPNPFNSETVINYQVPISSYVKLIIYNVLGKEVSTLVNSFQKAGIYMVKWDASNFSSGIYFYKIIIDDFIETKKMILVR